jgi:hypothetical protein
MPLYFYVLNNELFSQRLSPALAACWRTRSFLPGRALCQDLLGRSRLFHQRYHIDPAESLIGRVAGGLSFDRNYWRLLAGELLLVCADDVPEIQTTPDTLSCLLAPDSLSETAPREQWPAIKQAHFGTRDLRFGSAYYRPDFAGLNDLNDVRRLADYLAAQDPRQWRAEALAPLADFSDSQHREEELEFAREWFPALVALYQRARSSRDVIVCEAL